MSEFPFDEARQVGRVQTDTLYTADFKNGTGRYIYLVLEEENAPAIEYCPPFPSRNRIKITITFLKERGEIQAITIRRFKEYTTKGVSRWEEQRWFPDDPLTLSHFSFAKLARFLELIQEIDLANVSSKRLELREVQGALNADTQAKVRSLLVQPDGIAIVDELLNNGAITSHDIVNVGYRKKQLSVFREMLDEAEKLEAYRVRNDIKSEQPEKIWQHFFEANTWIFGFGLDYRFLDIVQSEAHIADGDLAGRDEAVVDFLLADAHFTVLVEVKRPDTPLFANRQNRAGTWTLSTALMSAVSQILEQKASWQIKSQGDNFDAQGARLHQMTIDPKSILIIGSEQSFSGTERETVIKRKTFELFRRDSRNIEIVTYDELYERAKFIVEHSARA